MIDVSFSRSKLILGDAVKVMPTLRDEFDVIIADPPYNISKNFGAGCDDNLPLADYLVWSRTWIDEAYKLLKQDGLLYVYGFSEILARIACLYPIENQRWLVWHYTNKVVPSSKFWQRTHESLLCIWKEKPALNVDLIREPYTDGYGNNIGKVRAATKGRFGSDTGTIYADNGGALPRDVIKVAALAGGAGMAERWFLCRDCNIVLPPSKMAEHKDHEIMKHPTQKPAEITRRLLSSRIADSDGKVLIPFAGSGSECVVASGMGITFTGIEQNPEYVDFATRWLAMTN